jgi:hypothetical protein
MKRHIGTMAACIVGLAATGALAQDATDASPLRSFDWTYQGAPEPGNRHWSSVDGVTWVETYPSGYTEVQKVGASAQVDGCQGVITTKAYSPTSQTFIPDPGCPSMVLLFRFSDRPWRPLGVMRSISTAAVSLTAPDRSQSTTPTPAYGPDNPRPGSARADLRPLMQEHPGEPMPDNRAALDAALARNDGSILKLLAAQSDPKQIYLELNWERARIYDGAGLAVSLAYMLDLWRMAPHLPEDGSGPHGDKPDQMKQTAVAFALYNFALIRLDGVRCADDSAPSHGLSQLAQFAAPILAYARALPPDERDRAVMVAVNVERATLPARKDDALLCSGGLKEIEAGLAANGDRPLPRSQMPGYVGSVTQVPDAPGYKTQFEEPATWRPRQQQIRLTIRDDLERIVEPALGPPSTAAPSP